MTKAGIGLVIGLCGGVFGAGGGVIAVLALRRLCGLDTRRAHAAAIGVMLPVTAVGAAVYLTSGGVDMRTLLWCAPGVAAGSVIGAKLTGRMQAAWLDRLFTLMMLLAGIWMVAR